MPFPSVRPGFSSGPLSVPPNDNIRPHTNGYQTPAAPFLVASPPPISAPTIHPSHEPPDCSSIPHDPLDPLTCRPTLLDADDQFPEFSSDAVQFALPALPLTPSATDLPSSAAYLVRALSRSALRMLWHQRLGHINFRRLSEMHRFVKGMPHFQIPTELEGCPICLAAKLRKAPAGTQTIMRATSCNQGLSIDFGFMVQKSRDSVRHNSLDRSLQRSDLRSCLRHKGATHRLDQQLAC